MIRHAAIILLIGNAFPALAVTLDLPGKVSESVRFDDGPSEIALPSGPWNGETVPTRPVTGTLQRNVWQLTGATGSPADIVANLGAQLIADGWTIDFACADTFCGGYDFRFASNTLPAPDMYVDLGNFRYLLASGPDGAALSLMVSEGRDTAWVQSTEVATGDDARALPDTSEEPLRRAPQDGALLTSLSATGRAVLSGVSFASGASELQEGSDAELARLAAYLKNRPSKTFAIVGHTDSDGGMAPNLALSRARAATVRRALIDRHGVPPSQIEAQGIGFLAPLARNDTDAGRRANRRVEIVATN